MTFQKYDGKSGFGKLPKINGGDLSSTLPSVQIQKTFFDLYLPGNIATESTQLFEPPLKKIAKNPHRKPTKRSKESPQQSHLDFGDTHFSEVRSGESGFRSVYLNNETSTTQKYPIRNLRQLKAKYHLTVLEDNVLASQKGQLSAVAQVLESSKNMALQGRTGSGKTIVELLVAAHYLAKGESVLLLAPTEALIRQHGRTVKKIFSMPEDSVCEMSGSTSADKREIQYKEKPAQLLIATPEALFNDAAAGRIDLSRFKLVIYDEGHLATGQYAYAKIDKLFPEETRRLLFSATLAQSPVELSNLLERMAVKDVIEIKAKQSLKFEVPVYLRISDNPEQAIYRGARNIFNAVLKCAKEMENALKNSASHKLGVHTHNSLLKQFQKLTNINKFDQQNTFGFVESPKFKFPPFKAFNKLGEDLSKLMESDDGRKINVKRYGRACSKFYELRYLMMLYDTLTSEGQYCFVRTLGEKFWRVRTGNIAQANNELKTIKLSKFHKNICNNKLVCETFDDLTKNTLMNELVRKDSTQIKSILKVAFPEGVKLKESKDLLDLSKIDNEDFAAVSARIDLKSVTKAFFRKAREEFIIRDYVDHPKELKVRTLISRYCGFDPDSKVMIYSASAHAVKFCIDRLNYHFRDSAIKGVAVVGKKHIKSDLRDINIMKFSNGEACLMGANSAANVGLDIPNVNVLIRLSHSSRAIEIEQTKGRVGRRDKAAYIYNIITLGVNDEYRYYSGYRNTKTMRRAVRSASSKQAELPE